MHDVQDHQKFPSCKSSEEVTNFTLGSSALSHIWMWVTILSEQTNKGKKFKFLL